MLNSGYFLEEDGELSLLDVRRDVVFETYLQDLLEYGLGKYDIDFYDATPDETFHLWAKYRKEQVQQLLLNNPKDIMLGTKIYDGVVYAYVTVIKGNSIKENLKYADGYIDPDTFQWETVANVNERELNSLKNSKKIHIFVRKVDNEDNRTSRLVERLREYFAYTQDLLNTRFQETGSRRLSGVDKNDLEYIAIYSTPDVGTLSFDCIRNQEFKAECHELKSLGELTAENILDGTDETAGILIRTQSAKVRKLNKQILSDLKVYYKYRCQICGEYIGERYGSNLIHAHHIDYFTHSLNNDMNNIMIVCPNHHGIIHDRNPKFDWKHLEYLYPNGYREGLRLNDHLKKTREVD